MASTTNDDVLDLTTHIIALVAVLLGIVSHAIIFSAHSNITTLVRSGRYFEMAILLLARCSVLTFFVISLLVLQLPLSAAISCDATTRTAIASFYMSHALHHLYHSLQTITIVKREIITSYIHLTLAGTVVAMSFYALCLTSSGVTYPDIGCVLLLDDSTLPSSAVLISLAAISLFHQLFTVARLIVTGLWSKNDAHQMTLTERLRSLPKTAVVEVTVSVIRLASLMLFFCVPVILLRLKPMALLSCLYVYVAVDVLLIAESLYPSSMTAKVHEGSIAKRRSSFAAINNRSVLWDDKKYSSSFWSQKEKAELDRINSRIPLHHLPSKEMLSPGKRSPSLSGFNVAAPSPQIRTMDYTRAQPISRPPMSPTDSVHSMEMRAIAFESHSRRLRQQHDLEQCLPDTQSIPAIPLSRTLSRSEASQRPESKATYSSEVVPDPPRLFAPPAARRDVPQRASIETFRSEGSVYSTATNWI